MSQRRTLDLELSAANQTELEMHSPGAAALATLSREQIDFIKRLPKAELHAHLNGCIPLKTLQQLAEDKEASNISFQQNDMVMRGLETLKAGVELVEIDDFFSLFPAIYALTSTPHALRIATKAVLQQFLDPGYLNPDDPPQCQYLELRTTPRENEHMTREEYLSAVLDVIEEYPPSKTALLVSVDRRNNEEEALSVVKTANSLRGRGRRIVGIDLCGTPTAGDASWWLPAFKLAQQHGMQLTVHIAETKENTPEDVHTLLLANPGRLGHATFLDEAAQRIVLERKLGLELCLSSNLLCKTVTSLEDHHINFWLNHDVPIAICTDDTLPFRNSLTDEYALLLAHPPFGLGLSEQAVERLAQLSFATRFSSP